MKRNEQSNALRYLHECFFSVNLALFSVTMLFLYVPVLWAPFSRMEVLIKTTLHIRQTDLITGHVAVWVPSMVVALCLWGLLRAGSNTAITAEILRSIAGLVALFAAPIFDIRLIKSYGFPYEGIPVELTFILISTLFCLSGKWQIKFWAGAMGIALHFMFLWVVLGVHNPLPGYFGPAGIAVSFCSAVAWRLYASRVLFPKQHVQQMQPVRM